MFWLSRFKFKLLILKNNYALLKDLFFANTVSVYTAGLHLVSTNCITSADQYRGHVSMTQSRRVCQQWSSQLPHSHQVTTTSHSSHWQSRETIVAAKNYCRDPSNDGYLWCYTTDNDKRWEACSVNLCVMCIIRAKDSVDGSVD